MGSEGKGKHLTAGCRMERSRVQGGTETDGSGVQGGQIRGCRLTV